MGYEMTRPAQKWTGTGIIASAFFLILFTLAVPYVNHFGEEGSRYTYYTKWSGNWKEGQMTIFNRADSLFNFPKSASIFIGLGLLIAIIGAIYVFWLVYSNKPCYITRERPGPVGGIIVIIGAIFYFIGNLIYLKWSLGSPRPDYGWPADNDFDILTVSMSPTFWIGLALATIILGLASTSIIYYLDTVSKRPVK
ncbi:MAG: hypothetical protein FK734_08170 [Asgard group archaeon]|nr:hypothetical protein [Asgard group archaeon]